MIGKILSTTKCMKKIYYAEHSSQSLKIVALILRSHQHLEGISSSQWHDILKVASCGRTKRNVIASFNAIEGELVQVQVGIYQIFEF